eukprot:535920-Amorphochlora_amoeboformis.AAC.1
MARLGFFDFGSVVSLCGSIYGSIWVLDGFGVAGMGRLWIELRVRVGLGFIGLMVMRAWLFIG